MTIATVKQARTATCRCGHTAQLHPVQLCHGWNQSGGKLGMMQRCSCTRFTAAKS